MASHEPDWDVYPRKFGKYHLLSPLAQGGMGALYLAVTGDRGLERMMVIKTVLPHLADSEYIARFRDEAKVVVKLSHGNLIPVFDAGMVGGELFLAMDFVEGRDLRAVWNRCAKKQVAFPIDVAVYIAKELCRGLAYAHSFPDLDLVHRDISPPNVLVSYTGEVKLTDFGLASSTLKIEKTAPGIIYGKVAYMSPEQARGEKLDGRSDMYATAIVLWELLTGRQLFPPGKDQPQDLLSRAKNPEVMRPSKRAPRVPIKLDEICLRALAADKADRYPTCDDMRIALQTWLAANAPTTDAGRISTFLEELFSDDIVRERNERVEMISRVRTRAMTMPPTDELRQLVERSTQTRIKTSGGDATAPAGDGGGPPVRTPGSVGRRATDRGDERPDRRKEPDRRNLRDGGGSAATALAEQPEAELDLTGAIIDGRYRIVELIGEGGMGKVYLAEHIEIGKRVALKVLHPSYSRMPDLVERFRREARAASKIGHPNIVDVTDSGTTEDGSEYFVMEYLEGVELGSVLEREGAVDVARALRIAAQICRALAAAHAVGIIHRDLKPENIYLVTRDGSTDVVKVLDFGIAKTTEAEAARERRLTSPGMAMGTPEYMAPEQAAGRPADARCDVYALGAILYEMTTGVPPYSGDNFMEILTKKATVDPPPPSSIRADLPAPVSKLVLDAMARDPDARPQTMEAFEYELNKCLAGRGVAVAQILGMTTDANLVASLNPGLSVRNLDDGGSVRPTSSPGMSLPRADSQLGYASGQMMMVSASAPGLAITPRATGEQRALPSSGQLAAAEVSSRAATVGVTPLDGRPSRVGVLGWIVLGAALFGGVGALLYVAVGERGRRSEVSAATHVIEGSNQGSPRGSDDPTRPAIEVTNPAVNPGSAKAGSDGSAMIRGGSDDQAGSADPSGANGSGSDDKGPDDKVPTKPDGKADGKPDGKADGKPDGKADGKDGTAKAHPDKPDKGRGPGDRGKIKVAVAPPVVVSGDGKGLIAQGKALEIKGNWRGAREVYLRLERVKGFTGQALYLQAWAAFNANDVDGAQQLSKRAIDAGGAYKNAAKMLFGDTLYRLGEYQRAKDFYVTLRKTLGGEDKAAAGRKIANCNHKLNLPETDGM
jgi:serine/threonine protein kinase/TolA-binding protein